MGGSSKSAAPASTTTTPVQQPTTTMQPFQPGMQQALADQLAMGYGQQPADIMAYLSSIYKPMTVPDYSPKAATPQPTPATATTSAPLQPQTPARSQPNMLLKRSKD